jgi:hypothetical protein
MSDDYVPPETFAKVAQPLPNQAWFGRLRTSDVRDRRFRMAAPPTDRTFRIWFSIGRPWDQGPYPHCVAYAVNRYLHTHPICNKPILPHPEFYKACQREDEWPGEDYDGTSARGAFKVLKARGLVESYGWADEAAMVARHVLEHGPVPLGSDWTADMLDTDRHGYIWPTGAVLGGHQTVLIGANMRRKNPDGTIGALRGMNSWGTWGHNGSGRFWLSVDALQKLLDGLVGWPGDAVSSIEVKKLAA